MIQTRKLGHFPVVLFGSSFWAGLIEWIERQLLASGNMAPINRNLLTVTDDPDEAVRIISASYERSCREGAAMTRGSPAGTE